MNNIRTARKAKGLTCEELGKIVGVQRSAISKYERDEIQPSKDILLSLAENLDVSTDYLLGKTDDPRPAGAELVIPSILKDVLVAFYDGEEDITQEEVDHLAEFAKFLKSKRKK